MAPSAWRLHANAASGSECGRTSKSRPCSRTGWSVHHCRMNSTRSRLTPLTRTYEALATTTEDPMRMTRLYRSGLLAAFVWMSCALWWTGVCSAFLMPGSASWPRQRSSGTYRHKRHQYARLLVESTGRNRLQVGLWQMARRSAPGETWPGAPRPGTWPRGSEEKRWLPYVQDHRSRALFRDRERARAVGAPQRRVGSGMTIRVLRCRSAMPRAPPFSLAGKLSTVF